MAYSYDQLSYESAYSFSFWRSSLGLDYKREDIDRDFREADIRGKYFNGFGENPTDEVAYQAKYLFGDREGNDYNNAVTGPKLLGRRPCCQRKSRELLQ